MGLSQQTKAESLIFRNKLLISLIFFFLLRVFYSYFFGWQEIPRISDGHSYNGYALDILNRPDWLTRDYLKGHYRAPGYPLFLALIYYIFGHENFFAVYLFQAIISTLTIYYIFKLSSAIFSEKKAFLALFWAGFYFFHIWYNGQILRETLIYFLIIFSFYQLWIFFQKKEETHFLKSIELWMFLIAFTYLLHTDTRYLFYIPFIAIPFVIYRKLWVGAKQYLCVLGILILLLIPWTIRNYIAYNGFVLINTRTLDMREEDLSIRLELFDTKDIKKPSVSTHFSLNKSYPSEEERTLIKMGINPNNRPYYEVDLIMNDVYPASTFIGRKIYYAIDMWVPFRLWWDYIPFPDARLNKPWSLRHNLVSILCYGTLLPFVLIGVFYLFRKKNKAVWFLVFPIFVQALLHFLTFGLERYRIPIDSFIIILGCFGIQISIMFIKEKVF